MKNNTMNTNDNYILHPSVFYRSINEKVVLYYTAKSMIYTFTGFAKEVFDFFSKGATAKDFFLHIEKEYEIDINDNEFKNGLIEFLETLFQSGVLVKVSKATDYSGSLENEISNEFVNSNRLYSATIELTYKCNEKCRHCYVSDEGGKELSTSQIKQILDELYDMGVITILFTGGEVFVRKDIFEILEYAYNKHFAVDIFTNGNLLDGNALLKLKAFWPKCIHFSVYSHISQKHDNVTQVKGSLDKTIAAIKMCRLLDIPAKIKMPVFSETVDDVEGVIELAKSLGTSISVSNDITPKKNGDTSPLDMRIISHDESVKVAGSIEDNIGNLFETEEKKTLNDRICSAGARMISINPYGKVFPCVNFPISIGDVTKQKLKDIWENSEELNWWRSLNIVSKRTECIDCIHLDYCRFCPGEAIMYTGNPILKYQDACYVTKCKYDYFN